jgi:hypothetical protein
MIAGQQEWDVEDILESRTCFPIPLFLIKWKGHHKAMWELPEHLNNLPLKVHEFYNHDPNAPNFPVPPPDPDSYYEDVRFLPRLPTWFLLCSPSGLRDHYFTVFPDPSCVEWAPTRRLYQKAHGPRPPSTACTSRAGEGLRSTGCTQLSSRRVAL